MGSICSFPETLQVFIPYHCVRPQLKIMLYIFSQDSLGKTTALSRVEANFFPPKNWRIPSFLSFKTLNTLLMEKWKVIKDEKLDPSPSLYPIIENGHVKKVGNAAIIKHEIFRYEVPMCAKLNTFKLIRAYLS